MALMLGDESLRALADDMWGTLLPYAPEPADDVAFLDSGGLSWLVRLRALASSKGGSVRVTASSARVERVLRISGVAPLFSG